MWSKTVEVAASIDALHESCYHAIYNLDYSITKTKALNTFFCTMYLVLYLILDYWSTGHMTSIEYLYYCSTTCYLVIEFRTRYSTRHYEYILLLVE